MQSSHQAQYTDELLQPWYVKQTHLSNRNYPDFKGNTRLPEGHGPDS